MVKMAKNQKNTEETNHQIGVKMKLTKLSYFLIFLSYLLESYLVVTLPANINDKNVSELLLVGLTFIIMIFHFGLACHNKLLYVMFSIQTFGITLYGLLTTPSIVFTAVYGTITIINIIILIIELYYHIKTTNFWKQQFPKIKRYFVITGDKNETH